jgi:hypothetical protein
VDRAWVKRAAVISFGEAFKSGWDEGKGRKKPPDSDWIDVRVVNYVGTDKGVRAVVVRSDGVVKEVGLKDLRYDTDEP